MNQRKVSTLEFMGIGVGVQALVLVALLLVDHLVWVAGYLAVGYCVLDGLALCLDRRRHVSASACLRLLFYFLPLALLLGFAFVVNATRQAR